MTTRTRAAVAAGFVVFVAGTAGAAYLGSRDGDTAPPAQGGTAVLYAAQPVAPGTPAATAVGQGLVRQKNVPAAHAPADALTDTSQLTGRVSAAAIPTGTVITADMFPAPKTRIGTVVIPPGRRALTVKLEPIAGVAGFAGAGDRVDIYGVRKSSEGGPPGVRLVLQGIEVLSVNGTGLPASQGQAQGPELVYLLAVTPAEAEKVIYLAEFEKLYFDLVARDEKPVGSTPGVGPEQSLQVL